MNAIHRAVTTVAERRAFGLPEGVRGLSILCGNLRFVSASSEARNVTCKMCRRKLEA